MICSAVRDVSMVSRIRSRSSFGLGPVGCLAEHLLASGLGKLAHLCIHALAVRRYPGIPVFHGSIPHLIYEPNTTVEFPHPTSHLCLIFDGFQDGGCWWQQTVCWLGVMTLMS